jgi:hypothetical protein
MMRYNSVALNQFPLPCHSSDQFLGFMVDRVARGQDLLCELWFNLASHESISAVYPSVISDWYPKSVLVCSTKSVCLAQFQLTTITIFTVLPFIWSLVV